MAYQVIYAGKPLHNYMDIHKINRTILPSRENSSKIIPSRHGSYYTSYKYAEKEISLECKFVGEDREDYMDKLRTVSYLLDVDSPKKLILGDAPDRYLLAVPDGSFEIERVGLIAQFTIIFKCYNPYEYSRTEKNTQRDTMAKVNGVWKANFEEADDADYVYPNEGDDEEVDYGSDDFKFGDLGENKDPKEFKNFIPQTINIEEKNDAKLTTNDSTSFLMNSNQHILNFYNTGSTSTYPVFHANFEDNANFFTCSNHEGKTVLIGQIPTIEEMEKPTVQSTVVLDDACDSLVDWTVAGNVLDDGRKITGSLGINKNGYAITAANYGSDSDGWHGAAGRRNLSRQVQDFRIEIDVEHESSGALGGISNTPSGEGGDWYIVNASSGINQRKGRGTNYGVIQVIPKGKKVQITSIEQKWGQCTYNGKTGYVCMTYMSPTTDPNGGSSGDSSTSSYKATANVYIRAGRGTNYGKMGLLPSGTTVNVTSIKNGWGYTSYKNVKGYVSMSYMKKVSSSTMLLKDEYDTETETREDRQGLLEVYGFDVTGKKLFKVCMHDSTPYFEYSQPEMYIGGEKVIDDGLPTPNPQIKTVTENDKTTTYKIDSGSVGQWNSFDGKFTIERTTTDGKQEWFCKVEKFSSGKVVHKIEKTLRSDKYPTEKVASIVIFIGQYKSDIAVDTQNVCNIKVVDLTPPDLPTQPIIKDPIFKKGDELIIDFDSQEVLLNGADFLSQLDITSNFFSIPVGMAEVHCQSDTQNMNVVAEYRERWL